MKFKRQIAARRNFGAESQRREHFVGVIIFANFTDGLQGDHVLIGLIRMNVMQRRRIHWISIGSRKINSDSEIYLGSEIFNRKNKKTSNLKNFESK